MAGSYFVYFTSPQQRNRNFVSVINQEFMTGEANEVSKGYIFLVIYDSF